MDSTVHPVREAKAPSMSLLGGHNSHVASYVKDYLDLEYQQVDVSNTLWRSNVETISDERLYNFINLKPVNDVRRINKFFETVNSELSEGGLYIGCFESKAQRKKRILDKYPLILAYFIYVVDFIWKRMFPKMSFTKKFYFDITNGEDRVLTLPEVLGRLVSCGFEIVNYSKVKDLTYFTVRKVKAPEYDKNPTYGPLIKLNRVGLNGKPIKVYKIRTMHPYSEYLQEFVYRSNSVQKGGKFKNDFRITNWGCFLRKFWLDELPMLYNWFKGDLKLVGVRPISGHYFELYPKRFQQRRLKCKPGLIPPFYADMPETMEEIFASEKKYIMEYEKSPYLTDIKYLFKSLYNIFIKRARSN